MCAFESREKTEKKSLTKRECARFFQEKKKKKNQMWHGAPTGSTSTSAQKKEKYIYMSREIFLLLSPISRHIVMLFLFLRQIIIYSFASLFSPVINTLRCRIYAICSSFSSSTSTKKKKKK